MHYFKKIKYSFTVVNSVFIFSKCLYLKTLNQSLLSFSKILVFGLFLFFGVSGFSQSEASEYSVTGKIIDQKSQSPIALCLIEVFDESHHRTAFIKSDFNGNFSMKFCTSLIQKEKLEFNLTAVGYHSKKVKIKIEDQIYFTFELKKDFDSIITVDDIEKRIPFTDTVYSNIDDQNKNNLYKHYCTEKVKTREEISLDNDNIDDWILINSNAQSDCQMGMIRAIYSANNGNYNVTFFGLMMMSTKERNYYEFKNQYSIDKYGISSSNGGCVVDEGIMCYSSKMEEIIYRKYGDTIFQKIDREAMDAYPIYLDSLIVANFVFKAEILDEEPMFFGGEDSMSVFINKTIQVEQQVKEKVYVIFIVEKDGSLSDVRVVKSNDEKLNNEVVRVVKLMPNWSPGILNGQKVRAKVVVPINFN